MQDQNERKIQLAQYMPYLLVVASDRTTRLVGREYERRFGLTLQQWRVLAVLAAEGPLSHQQISSLSTLEHVAISRAASDLMNRNLIFRQSGGDRRQRIIALTEAGGALYRRIIPLAFSIEASLLAAVSAEDRMVLDRVLKTITAAADEMLQSGLPDS